VVSVVGHWLCVNTDVQYIMTADMQDVQRAAIAMPVGFVMFHHAVVVEDAVHHHAMLHLTAAAQ
jgi:hypothetical protein